MFEALISYLPSEWHRSVEFIGAPLWWIPEWQSAVINFGWYADSISGVLWRRFFLLLPILLLIVAVWSTMLSLYTLPFRSNRGKFLTIIALGWWDTGRGIWFFWTGMMRFAALLVGWAWSLVALIVRMAFVGVKGFITSPLALFDSVASRYLKPGVPWIAVMLTLVWAALEATIFSFTLMPTMTEVLADITGFLMEKMVEVERATQEELRQDLKSLFQGAIRVTLEMVLEEELKAMVGARRFERVGSRKDHRNGTYLRRLLTSLGQIDVMVPRSREGGSPADVMGRYRRRSSYRTGCS